MTRIQAISRMIAVLTLAFAPLVASFAQADGVPVPAGTPAAQSADAPAAGAPAQQQPGTFGMIMPMLAVFAVMYFFMIRPQQKKMKDHKALLDSLKKGDDVVTASGFLGKVHGITEKVVTLELADNVRVKLLKSQVSQVVSGQQIGEVVS
ncbi:MAG: preprotein translocase subunit YajC [Bdellovibrionales bacterium]|nr:preprotein translocase subunit YajC [Bdellovibrionales bacterium]